MYGPTKSDEKKTVWEEIYAFCASLDNEPRVIESDFNATLTLVDKMGRVRSLGSI